LRFFIIAFVFFTRQLCAQSVNTLMGARATGLAFASSTLSDEWSLFNNVGGLAKIDRLSGSFAYEVRPSLPGTKRMAATLNTPFKFGTAGLGFFRFGDDLYSEQIISAGFGNQFGIASLGLKANYIQYRAEGFGVKSAVSINFGGIADITPRISVGAYITNINQPKISIQDNERIPTRLAAGISFKPTDKILLLTEVEKDIAYDPTIKGAFEYSIHKKVFFRTGFNLQPNAGFFGLGFNARRVKIDYGIQYSEALSFTHHASAIYRFEKKRPEDEN